MLLHRFRSIGFHFFSFEHCLDLFYEDLKLEKTVQWGICYTIESRNLDFNGPDFECLFFRLTIIMILNRNYVNHVVLV